MNEGLGELRVSQTLFYKGKRMKLENRYTKKQMIENINECILKLYENESKKAMEQVLVLLEQFQTMIENCNEDDNLSEKRKGLSFLHELLEQYKYGDILAIADCLQKNAKQFIEEYYEINQKENSGLRHEYI